MAHDVREMIDVTYDLQGRFLPAGYQFLLWPELVRCLPWLEAEAAAGMHPLRGATGGGGMLLPQRAKLMLRLPAAAVGDAAALSGRQLRLESGPLQVGAARVRILQPCNTLHSHLVEGAEPEGAFLDRVGGELEQLGIACKWICGKRASIHDARRKIEGYSLVLHDLKPDASLQLQYRGLGDNRHFGCGIFVQYKTIAGLD